MFAMCTSADMFSRAGGWKRDNGYFTYMEGGKLLIGRRHNNMTRLSRMRYLQLSKELERKHG